MRFRRLLLWGAVLAPVLAIPTSYAVARAWLNRHLQREIALGEYRLRMVNPALDWDLDFAADSVEFASSRVSLSTGPVAAEVRIWNSLASIKPEARIRIDTVRANLVSGDSSGREKRRKRKKTPAFPNIRIPFDIRMDAARFELSLDGKFRAALLGPALASQGPKGASVEWRDAEVGLPGSPGGDTEGVRIGLSTPGRASARWFGKSVRYQLRAGESALRSIFWEGERRKSDLREGRDSVEADLPDLSVLEPFVRRGPPDFRDLSIRAALTGSGNLKARISCTTPRVWVIAPQRAEISAELRDSSGRLSLTTHGPSGETVYLQGRFRAPRDSGGPAALLSRLTGDFAGYSRNLRFRIGRRMLPGDAEIRKLRVLPGPVFEAQVRTRDNSDFKGRVFRRPGLGWTAAFEGSPSPRETWARAWTDTNVAYRSARVIGEADRGGLRVQAWIRQPRAYGFVADSVWAAQTINKSGYYLTASRVYGKDAVWPITGEVEWKRRDAGSAALGRTRPKRRVSLGFRTQHPRYGAAGFSMPGPGSIMVRADKLWAQKLPYARLPRLSALAPVVDGAFDWDIRGRNGRLDAEAAFSYAGQALGLDARADWNASLLSVRALDLSVAGSTVKVSGAARLGGRHFWQAGKLRFRDLRSLSVEAHRFDAARLAPFAGPRWPVARGTLNGRLDYDDSAGFGGSYRAEDLDLTPIRKLVAVRRLVLEGRGGGLAFTARTASTAYPWLNDTLRAEVSGLTGGAPAIEAEAVSDDGLKILFSGHADGRRAVKGVVSVAGRAELPGGAGEVRDIRLAGRIAAPLSRSILAGMVLDSGSFAGRYAVPGLDTQAFAGTMSLKAGRLRIPDLRSSGSAGGVLEGEAEVGVAGTLGVTARLRGDELALRWPGLQKLALRGAEAVLRVDSAGMSAKVRAGQVEFASLRPPISYRGALEAVSVDFDRPVGAKGETVTPRLKVKAGLRDFLFKHKIGFRDMQKSIGKVKVDKRKKRAKPMDLQLNLETVGAGNRIETDVLRMAFAGELAVRGIYPYTILTGEFSALKGELGQTSQSYDITDFDLKWQNATLEEGRVSVEGGKKLRVNCKPETERTCNVFIKLGGRLDEMAFTYDTDCGANTGENLEPTALINSVSRGCWSEEDVAGTGGGNYREAMMALLEPTLNEKLSSVGERFTGGWIKRTAVTGIGSAVARDTTANEPLAIGVETKEKWGVSVKASAGYHPEKREENTWESKVAVEWRPPLERASKNSEWKRRVRDRVTLEASAETRPEEKVLNTDKDARMQVGVRYRYKFWNLW